MTTKQASLLSPEMNLRIREILKCNGIHDPVSEITVVDPGLRDETFGGVIEYVTVKFENHSNLPLHLFVKRETDLAEYNQMLDEWQVFHKESTFFMKYLPIAGEYCKLMGHEELMKIYPKCYFGDGKMIVLENLVLEKNYVSLNKEEMQDFETAKIAIINLAKHHAVSYAILREHGDQQSFFQCFNKLKNEAFCTESNRKMISSAINNAIYTILTILEKSETNESQEAADIYRSLIGSPFDDVLKSMETDPDELLVLIHGDYWNNNMMFLKDTESHKIMDQIMVDFQGVRYGSPSVDISFYLYTSVKPQVRRERHRELITSYLDTLSLVGNQLKHPMNLSYKHLEKGIRKHSHLGYWFGILLSIIPSHGALKDIKIYNYKDVAEMKKDMEVLITKWAIEQPDRNETYTRNVIEYVKEYEQFRNVEKP